MPKCTLSAGKEIETLSQAELNQSLRDWMVEAVKGMRPVLIAAQGAADTAGSITLGGATTLTGGTLGPGQGMVWAVTRLCVRVDSGPAAFSVYMNQAGSHRLVRDIDGSSNGYAPFGNNELILPSGDQLVIRASSLTPSSTVTVTGAAIEMPAGLLWKWLAG